jgi:hypothetical protein
MRKSESLNVVAQHERLFFNSLTKVSNRTKNGAESPLGSMDDCLPQQSTSEEDKFEITYDGKSYTHLSLKLYPLCNKEYPQVLEGIHMRYTHMMISFG